MATIFARIGVGGGRVKGARTAIFFVSLGVFDRSKDVFECGCDVFGIKSQFFDCVGELSKSGLKIGGDFDNPDAFTKDVNFSGRAVACGVVETGSGSDRT